MLNLSILETSSRFLTLAQFAKKIGDLSKMLILKNLDQLRRKEKFCLYVPGKIIRTFHVVVVERTSKKCIKTCNAPEELFFSCVNQLFVDVRSIVKPAARLTRLKIPNARAKPATGQWVTMLIRTVSVMVTVSSWPTFLCF